MTPTLENKHHAGGVEKLGNGTETIARSLAKRSTPGHRHKDGALRKRRPSAVRRYIKEINACAYCGLPGHALLDCLVRPTVW